MSCLYLLIGSFQRKKQTTFAYILYVYASSAILLTILSLLFNVPFTGYKTQSYVFMILLAIVSQLTGHSCFNWALKHFRVESVAIVILGEPIGASILAYFIFKESIDTLQLAGIALILWAIRISTKRGIIIN